MNAYSRFFTALGTSLTLLTALVSAPAGAASLADQLNAAPAPTLAAAPKTVTVDIVANRTAGTPRSNYLVGIRLRHEPGWHTYWKFSGDTGYPASVEWTLPRNWVATAQGWPLPKRTKTGNLTNFVYSGEVLLPFKLEIPWGTPYGTSGTIRAKVEWLACKDVCIPGEASVRFSVPIRVASDPSEQAPLFALTRKLTPEKGSGEHIRVVRQDSRLRIDLAPLAGRIEKKIDFLPDRAGLIDLKGEYRQVRQGDSTALFLTAGKALKTGQPLEGVLVADDGPTRNGWAIAVSLPVHTGDVAEALEPRTSASAASPPKVVLRPLDQDRVSLSLWAAVGFAFLGGLILNLMPCVFPVLSLKILQLVDGSRRRGPLVLHGVVFSAGILLSMLALAGVLIALRSLGFALGWGFQLQNPLVVSVLALLFFAIALNLFGLFEFTAASHLTDKRAVRTLPAAGPAGSFWTGVLAVIVASPCTAPFMGAALGFAITQNAATSLAVFLALGAGMALPWLLLTLMPFWVRWLPRPGAWMVTFKQIMAIPMVLACLWLFWVLSRQVNIFGLFVVLFATGSIAILLWAIGREQYGRGRSWVLKSFALVVTVVCLGLIAVGLFNEGQSEQNERWQVWSESAVEQALGSGTPVVIDFTAAWCVTCQFNKATALRTQAAEDALDRLGYQRFSADWTNRDADITRKLNAFGRTGVPLYLLYDTKGRPTVLPELLTEAQFIRALEKNAPKR